VSAPTTLLVDGDILAYRAAASTEKSINWGEGIWTVHGYEEDAVRVLEEQIASLAEQFPGAEMVFCLTDGRNFRTDVYPLYKSNRKETRKPLTLPFLREHLLDKYRTYLRPTLEGDDCIGILATSPTIIPGPKIIASIDKDFKTIPCRYWDFHKKQMHETTEADADRYHLYQTLIGDATDGYPGCPGIGPKTAERLLEAKGATWDTVLNAYVKAGLTEEDALVQARCARILRATDFDFKAKKPILWSPAK